MAYTRVTNSLLILVSYVCLSTQQPHMAVSLTNPCAFTTCLNTATCLVGPQTPDQCPPFVQPCPPFRSLCLGLDDPRLNPCSLTLCPPELPVCVSRIPASCPFGNFCLRESLCVSRTSPGKAGQCPMRPGFGPCVVLCGTDAECPGAQKCCGGCPRDCQNPVFDRGCPRLGWWKQCQICRTNKACVLDGQCGLGHRCCRVAMCGGRCVPVSPLTTWPFW